MRGYPLQHRTPCTELDSAFPTLADPTWAGRVLGRKAFCPGGDRRLRHFVRTISRWQSHTDHSTAQRCQGSAVSDGAVWWEKSTEGPLL